LHFFHTNKKISARMKDLNLGNGMFSFTLDVKPPK
jgi:hypothetical protein